MNNTVSIIIPTYNRCKLVNQCVESLLAQTFSALEIIVVDDGSSDDTAQVLTSMALQDNRIKYFPRPHLGACAARNFGLQQAKGEYIGFFDSDDLWPPDYIETMVKNLQAKNDFGAAYSQSMRYSGGQICGQYGAMANPPSGYITTDLFSGKPFILPSSTIFRKNVWDDIFWDEVLKNRQDFDVFLRVSIVTKFMYIPDAYAIHRKDDNGISIMAGKDVFDDGPRVMERFYFRLGGKAYLPKRRAFRQLSHKYRHFALRNLKSGNRSVSILLLKLAIFYCPFDLRLYLNLFRAFILNPRNDKAPDWQLPPELPSL